VTVVDGVTPTIILEADTIPAAWEASIQALWKHGARRPTQYDKPDDPPGRAAVAVMHINDPLSEPRIHKAYPGGIGKLVEYTDEVVDGIHDHWVDMHDPKKWHYTYHGRFAGWSAAGLEINQIETTLDLLVKAPHTRRAQMTTWNPAIDPFDDHCPCLQRLWFTVGPDDKLQMHAHIRSNDAFKAAFMNIYAFTEFQAMMARRLSERLGRKIEVGLYKHFADDYHIYGAYFDEVSKFFEKVDTRPFAERTWRTADVQPVIDEARGYINRGVALPPYL
jgi:thymidylate synthase